MTLIKSISGIRGTIGGEAGKALTPIDIAKYTLAFGSLIKGNGGSKIVVGRDARISGEMVQHIVIGNLLGLGFNVVDLGLSPTPTVEMAVTMEDADAGIIITASHNPKQWNALKLLNDKGEFISAEAGEKVLEIAEEGHFIFPEVNEIGKVERINDYIDKHIEKILELPLVDTLSVKDRGFKVVVDGINSVGGISIPQLLVELGVEVFELGCDPTGEFQRKPEPIPDNLSTLINEVKFHNADLGIAVDPDVDRLVLIDEKGEPIGEEYTIVTIADYILQNKSGNTVTNMSSTIALKGVTEKYGGKYFSSAVGEVNVVAKMKEVDAVIGGEGNGGVIYPELHYGRDAMVGVALLLTYMAKSNKKLSQLRASYPNYFINKDKAPLEEDINMDAVLSQIANKYSNKDQSSEDGLKIFLDDEDWVHLRKSNTEPIIRIIAESHAAQIAQNIVTKFKSDITEIIK